MWIKICANTNLEDARLAAELGADAVGFVFAPSKRRVTPEQVRGISSGLPEWVERVGVFTSGSVEEIAEAADHANLNAVQLHGGLDLAFAGRLAECMGPTISIITTLHWTVGADEESANEVAKQLEVIAASLVHCRVLLDAKVGAESGGTGMSFDWARAHEVLASRSEVKVIAAGGLRPDNVAEAVRILQPWGVDVASGVEREPGRKDAARLRAFIENARGAGSL